MMTCYFCKKEIKYKKDINSISCAITKTPSGNIKFIMRVRGRDATYKYNWGNHRDICNECNIKAKHILYNNSDTIFKEIANELEELYCGKIMNVILCKSLEKGNGN